MWVDTSASMAWDPAGKERPARGLAGALAYLALAADDRAACVGFAGSVVGRAGPLRGKRSAPRLWAALAALPRGVSTDWSAVAGAARSVPRGVAVVFSDFLTKELPRQALAALCRAPATKWSWCKCSRLLNWPPNCGASCAWSTPRPLTPSSSRWANKLSASYHGPGPSTRRALRLAGGGPRTPGWSPSTAGRRCASWSWASSSPAGLVR